MIKYTKTVIAVRLALMANFNSAACPVKFPRFKILNNRNNRNARTTESILVIGIKNDKTRGLISKETYSLLGWKTSGVYTNEIYSIFAPTNTF